MICSKCGTGGGLMETAAQCRGPLQETIHHCNNNRLLLFHSPAQWKMYFSFLIFPAGFFTVNMQGGKKFWTAVDGGVSPSLDVFLSFPAHFCERNGHRWSTRSFTF
jgi:hypothetical protein